MTKFGIRIAAMLGLVLLGVLTSEFETISSWQSLQSVRWSAFTRKEFVEDGDVAQSPLHKTTTRKVGAHEPAHSIYEHQSISRNTPFESAAPRTYAGEYNEIKPGVKYLIYTPSGGFNNQRAEVEYALDLGRSFGRTLVVPMGAKHTSLWRKYWKLKTEDLFPMDRLLDFGFMSKYGDPVVPLNIQLSEFVANLKRKFPNSQDWKQLIIPQHGSDWNEYHEKLRSTYIDSPERFLMFKGAFFHQRLTDQQTEHVAKYFRYSAYLRNLALKISASIGPKFNAIHLRRGDYSKRSSQTGKFYYEKAIKAKFELDLPLYIATEPTDDKKIFAPLPEKFTKLMFAEDLPQDLIQEFLEAFPPGKIRNDMFGLIEQLICAKADGFIGTKFSSFTAWIEFMRAHRSMTFPETSSQASTENNDSDGGQNKPTGESNRLGNSEDTKSSYARFEEENSNRVKSGVVEGRLLRATVEKKMGVANDAQLTY